MTKLQREILTDILSATEEHRKIVYLFCVKHPDIARKNQINDVSEGMAITVDKLELMLKN